MGEVNKGQEKKDAYEVLGHTMEELKAERDRLVAQLAITIGQRNAALNAKDELQVKYDALVALAAV